MLDDCVPAVGQTRRGQSSALVLLFAGRWLANRQTVFDHLPNMI